MQVLRTLREYDVHLSVQGKRQALDGDHGLLALMRAWLAQSEGNDIVSRLGGIEASIYGEGNWYLSEHLLPFTWRAKSAER